MVAGFLEPTMCISPDSDIVVVISPSVDVTYRSVFSGIIHLSFECQKKESKKQTRTNDMWFSIAPGVVPIYEPVATATPIIETPLHCMGGGFIFSLLCTCVYFRVHLTTYKYTCVISL